MLCACSAGFVLQALPVALPWKLQDVSFWNVQVVMQLVRLLPDGHRMKREVDMALDAVSETMTPMHYHLREIIISTYRQVGCSFGPM